MVCSIIFGGRLIRRACPTKCFGYGDVVDVYLQAKRDGAAAKRFVTVHAEVHNLFNLGRHPVRSEHYRNLRTGAFAEWSRAVA